MRHLRPALLTVLVTAALAHGAVYNLKVVTDASPDFTDLPSLVHSVTSRWTTDEEKLWALYYQVHLARRQCNPIYLHGNALTDPIRQFNDYGYTMCSTVSGLNCSLWDFMGYRVRYWDISLHTVPEVFYGGRWHMYDNSMSALYTLCDGTTLAGVEDIGKEGACAASGGKSEPAHIARYHCLYASSPNGYLTGADDLRSLADEGRCFNPGGLKYRSYYYDWDRGHRYSLNLRDGESYERGYSQGGKGSPEWFVPNGVNAKGPVDPDGRYGLRGNGTRHFVPDLADLAHSAYASTNVKGGAQGVEPTGPNAQVTFKVEGANVLTCLRLTGETRGAVGVDVSTTGGLTWTEVGAAQGDRLDLKLVDAVNGAYDVLVRCRLSGTLRSLACDAVTQLNAKTQPRLNVGRNEVYVGAGDQTESVVVWPDLQGDRYKPYVVDEQNVATAKVHPGYQGTLFAAKAGEPAWVTFRLDSPGDATRLSMAGRLYNRAPKAHIEFLHSFDGGRTWVESYRLTETGQPWDVLHDSVITDLPAGTRSVLCRYRLEASTAGSGSCSLYAVRLELQYKPAATEFKPLAVTFAWDEVQTDYKLVRRSHTEPVTRLPHKYVLNVGGADHPRMASLRVGPATGASGYSDGQDVGGEKYVGRRVTVGTNFAVGCPYTVSTPSLTNWGAGDPDGRRLTDGVVGSSFAGGSNPATGCLWDPKHPVDITVDLGAARPAGAFRIHLTSGWPWPDALRGEYQDKVSVETSLDGQTFTAAGAFDLRLRRKDIPYNHMLNDDEKAQGWNFELVPPTPVNARWVRFKLAPAHSVVVTEVQVLDFLRYEPFDLRLALPG